MSNNKKIVKIENAPLKEGDTVVCKRMSEGFNIGSTSTEKRLRGTPGKVVRTYTVLNLPQYVVKWKIGVTLDLIDGKSCPSCDFQYTSDNDFCTNEECPNLVETGEPKKLEMIDEWYKIETVEDDNLTENYYKITKRQFLNESREESSRNFVELSKFYDIGKISKFLELLRKSGVVNMMMAPQYLYLGKERIEHEHKYTDLFDEFENYYNMMLDMADEIKYIMIMGAENKIENRETNQESEDEDEEFDYSAHNRNLLRIIKKDSIDLFKLWTKIKGGMKR
jgi:hypothetical protein